MDLSDASEKIPSDTAGDRSGYLPTNSAALPQAPFSARWKLNFCKLFRSRVQKFSKKPRNQFKILGVRRVTRSSFGPQILGARTTCCTPDLGEFQGSKCLSRSFVIDSTETSERLYFSAPAIPWYVLLVEKLTVIRRVSDVFACVVCIECRAAAAA
jgi:hypothetical protein